MKVRSKHANCRPLWTFTISPASKWPTGIELALPCESDPPADQSDKVLRVNPGVVKPKYGDQAVEWKIMVQDTDTW